jgi:hypothetical protein
MPDQDQELTPNEAMLALVLHEIENKTWFGAQARAKKVFRTLDSDNIRRALALGADKQMSEPYDGLPIGHLISLIASAKRGDPIQQADVDALEEWRSTRSPVVDKQPVIEPRELALEKQLADAQQDARDATTMIAQAHREKAAAVARAEKAEAEAVRLKTALEDEGRLGLFRAGMIGRVEAQVRDGIAQQAALISERNALAAELETARANVLAANLRTRTANDERDALAAKLAEKEATRVRIYNELIAYQHERDRLAGIADRAGRILDEAAAREARLDAKEHG